MINGNPSVLSLVWNLIRGGSEGQCARTALAMRELGHPHRVGVFRAEGFFLDAVNGSCGPVYEMDIHHLVRPHTLRMVRRLARFIQDQDIQIVHAWDADAVIFGSMAAKRAGVPFISSRRDLGEIYPPHKKWLMKRADLGAAAVVANARAIADQAIREGIPEAKLRVIPNILDLVEHDRLRDAAIEAATPPRIIMVARLDPEKDVATLLQALPDIREDARLVVVGDGACRSELEAQAAALGVAERVEFTGTVDHIVPLLQAARIGVLVPNANEGLSNTLLEYMAAALPVVVTDCGGNRELVEDGASGFIVPIGDHAAIACRVNELLDGPERAAGMGAAGRARVEQGHQPSEIVSRFASLYKELCP